MNSEELLEKEDGLIKERYTLAMERIESITNEETVKEPYLDYFKKISNFIVMIKDLVLEIENNQLCNMSQEELARLNQRFYEDIKGASYETSYANPEYASKCLGNKYGKILSFLYSEIRGMIVYGFEGRIFDITINAELFIEIYNYFEEIDEYTYKNIKSTIYYFISDYSEITVDYRTRELLDPSLSFARDIIMEEDLNDLRYLYKYGEYISSNEIQMAEHLNSLDQEQIEEMASTYTEGYRKGFIANNIDMTKKSTVNIRYPLGFERIVRAAIRNFRKMHLEPTIYRYAVNSIHKKRNLKIGYFSTSPNKQYDYDHRFDDGLYLDHAFNERKLVSQRVAYEKYNELANKYGGPAVIEIFGEKDFNPINKKESIILDEKQQKLSLAYSQEAGLLSNEYIKREEISFTIIAYPIPEIGSNFKEIFNETVKINTLDSSEFEIIQQRIIDVLDQGDYVRVTGAHGNQTNIKVNLYKLEDHDKQTIFENCVADVNIPVGEVFTSPVLKGTEGVLHVKKVFLNDLEYSDLSLLFEDGMIKDYTCKNYEDENENKRFVKENLLGNHETLPIGEFAIGTNTTAYVVGEKYKISNKFPILIAEKTGPHFAIGDTCYMMSEDLKTFNSDGKQIVARDNEYSILRKTETKKAYFNCHTDITIPYHELGDIIVHTKDGKEIAIISSGRFVLPGTEFLNQAFNEE